MQEKKLFLLDAYALIYRSYYAFIKNPRINSKGVNTSAIFGFVNTLEDVLKKENPSHIAVGFDPSGPTFRHEAYELYKAGEMPYGTCEYLGLDKGCVGIVTNDNYYEHVSEEQAAAIDQAKQDIIDGKIKVSSAYGMTSEDMD